MKTAKRLIAVLLSAILILGLLPCSVFADSSSEELVCKYYFGNETTYKYGGVLCPGENTFSDAEKDTPYYFTFVPEQTGVYCFDKEVAGITADTDDNQCSAEDFEDLLTLYTEDDDSRADYSFLTTGTTYYVLIDSFEGVVISFEGTVTDVEPSIPLVDLVDNWDVVDVKTGFKNGRVLDLEMAVTFSSDKTLYGWGFYFDSGEFTEDSAIWNHLGFEKTFTYNAIDIKDMVSSVEPKNSVEFVKYYDGKVAFADPVTLVIRFSDGTSTEVVIEDYDYFYTFSAPNCRNYRVYLDADENDELFAWIVGSAFGSIDYTIKRAGFSKDLVYFLLQCKSTISFWYTMLRAGADLNTKVQVVLDCIKDIGELRIRFLKSLISKVL